MSGLWRNWQDGNCRCFNIKLLVNDYFYQDVMFYKNELSFCIVDFYLNVILNMKYRLA